MSFDCCLNRLVTRLHTTVGRAPASVFENATEWTSDCGLENKRWGKSRRDRRNLTAEMIRQNAKEISRKLVTSFSKANERRAVTGQCSTGHNQSGRPALGRIWVTEFVRLEMILTWDDFDIQHESISTKKYYFFKNIFPKCFRILPETINIQSISHENQLCKNLNLFSEISMKS